MAKGILKLTIIILTLLNAGYMAFDGFTAFQTGDYIRPTSGKYAGELGPWSMLAELAHFDPMSDLMKGIFLGLGIFGLLGIIVFLFRGRKGSVMLLLFCILTLWNLIAGTVISFLTLLLLVAYRRLNRVSHLKDALQK